MLFHPCNVVAPSYQCHIGRCQLLRPLTDIARHRNRCQQPKCKGSAPGQESAENARQYEPQEDGAAADSQRTIDHFSLVQLSVALPCIQGFMTWAPSFVMSSGLWPSRLGCALYCGLGPVKYFILQDAAAEVSCGFGLSPWLVQQLSDYPQIAFGAGPLVAQLVLAGIAGGLIQRALSRNGVSSANFFKYSTSPRDLGAIGILVCVAIAGGIVISKLSGAAVDGEIPSSVAEMQSIVSSQQPVAVLGAGAASILVAPWIEERIYRGAILQGLLPHLGPVASVGISAGLFAASHVTSEGFLQLCCLGTVLGIGHLYSKENLLVPTFVHSAFNCILFCNILFR